MKFKIIATVAVIVFLIVLTFLFVICARPHVETDADGNPVEVQTQ